MFCLYFQTIKGFAYNITDTVTFDKRSTEELKKIIPFQNQLLNDPIIAPLEMVTHTASRGRSIWLYATNPTHLLIRNDALLIDSLGLVSARYFVSSTALRVSPGFCPVEVLPDAVLSTNQMGQISVSLENTIGMASSARLAWFGNYEIDEVFRGSMKWMA